MNAHSPKNAAVWFELPVRDLESAAAFYGTVLAAELTREAMEGRDIAVFPYDGGVGGHLIRLDGEPGAGAIVHLAAPAPLEETLSRVTDAGGRVVSGIIVLPEGGGGGRFAYCQDPDGNRFGLYTAS